MASQDLPFNITSGSPFRISVTLPNGTPYEIATIVGISRVLHDPDERNPDGTDQPVFHIEFQVGTTVRSLAGIPGPGPQP